MLSKSLNTIIKQAFETAEENRFEYVTVEQLTLALMQDEEVQWLLKKFDLDIEALRQDLTTCIFTHTPKLEESQELSIQPTNGFQRVLQRAMMHVQSSGKTEISCLNTLVSIFGERDSHSVYLFAKRDVTRLDVVRYISHEMDSASDNPQIFENPDEQRDDSTADKEASADQSTIKYATNLNAKAADNKIDPLIGRQQELAQILQTICRRRKSNPLLVGEAGVGKTSIVEGLALRIVQKQVPEPLLDATIYSLDLGAMIAGTKYRGEFEKRINTLLKQLQKETKAILFIDEIHTIVGAGHVSNGALDASNIIKPMLASGELTCIGSTTYQEYRGIFEKDRALSRRFQKIDIPEPSPADAIKILQGIKPQYEAFHKVRYTKNALHSAVTLAHRYLNDRFLPDTAIDVIDEAGAQQNLLPKSQRKQTVGVTEIEHIIGKIARIPPKNISKNEVKSLKTLDRELKVLVFGQDHAIAQLTSSIKLARSGLRQTHRTIGSFIFAGPTGVGKTEVARQLASTLNVQLNRFDMSEYMERHTVSRLIGAPPGYVGYDQGGLLTEAIHKHPHCVLLLDEIEKAHTDVYNLLLQVMDYGTLTDANGRKIDFRNVILIMTTNAGAEAIQKRSIGFTQQNHASDMMQEIKKTFTPEFINRLDSIIQFNSLDRQTITHVVNKFILELEGQLEPKNINITVTQDARDWLAENGFDEKTGGRPIAGLIDKAIKQPLADEILFGKLVKGGHVEISASKDSTESLAFKIAPTAS